MSGYTAESVIAGAPKLSRRPGRRPVFGQLSGRHGGSLLVFLVVALGIIASVLAQQGDMLARLSEWEGGGKRYSLVPVPEPNFTGREPAMQHVLQSVRNDLLGLVQQRDVKPEELSEGFGELGRYYHAHHLYGPASACYINAERLAPGVFRWPYLLGYTYYQASHPDKAVAAYQRALRIKPGDAAAQLRLATVYVDLNQPDLAEPLLEEPLQQDGFRETAAFLKGKLALARRDYENAVRYF